MKFLSDTFNNRELALIVWGLGLFVWVLTKPGVRESFKDLLRVFIATKVIAVVSLMIVYVSVLTGVFRALGIWTTANLKDTIVWTMGVGFVLLVSSTDSRDDERFFRKLIIANITWMLLLEFLANLYAFNFWVECLLVPVVAVVVGVKAVADMDSKYKSIRKLLEFVIAMYGLSVLSFSVYGAVNDFAGFATVKNLKDLLLPPVYTFCYLPFLYIFALVARYEEVFIRLDFVNKDRALVAFAKRRLVLHFHVSLVKLSRWSRRAGCLTVSNREDVYTLLRR